MLLRRWSSALRRANRRYEILRKWNIALVRTASLILILSLVLWGTTTEKAVAKPIPQLSVDVWTDRGGQGPNAPSGQYQLGETPTVYFTASIGCQVTVTLTGPYGQNSWQQQAMYGPVYTRPLGDAEAEDIGQWQVALQARTADGSQQASDSTWFTVVGPPPPPPPVLIQPPASPPPDPEPEPSPPPAPEPDPTPLPVKDDTSVGIDAARATLLDALKALKMAEGELTIDLKMDTNGDGQVTSKDARLILKWMVEDRTRTVLDIK